MKQATRIIALVMAVAMVVCMSAFCVSAEDAVATDLVQSRAGSIVVDGAKDLAYDNAAKITFGTADIITAEGWLAWDADYLYFFVDVADSTNAKEPDDVWGKDCIDYFVDFGCDDGEVQYRIARDGSLSDAAGPTLDVAFKGVGVEKEDNSGWTAEFAVPVPAGAQKVSIGAFAQDWDQGTWGTQVYTMNGETQVSVWNHQTFIPFNLVKSAPKVADGAIVLDGKKDYEYKDAAIVNYGVQATVSSTGYVLWDSDKLYYLVEIYDSSVNTELKDETQPWNSENTEICFDLGNGNQGYRVSRNGVLSDPSGKMGAECEYPFEAKVSEMANGNGWYAELAIPLDGATSVKVASGFAQDWDVYGNGWNSAGLAMVQTDTIILDDAAVLYENAGEITLDGVKDDAYADATVIAHGEQDTVSAIGYLTWKGDTVYYLVEVYDATVNTELNDEKNPWNSENVEIGNGKISYRVSRNGTISDQGGNIGEAVVAPFDAKVSEMADGKGWIAEFAIPRNGAEFTIQWGFAQDWDVYGADANEDGKIDYNSAGLAMSDPITGVLAEKAVSNYVLFEDASPIAMQKGDMRIFSEPFVPTASADGITVWFRVSGLKEPLVLTYPKAGVLTKHFEPIFVTEPTVAEDGTETEKKVLGDDGNYITIKDGNGNTIFSQEAEDRTLDTHNHGQDGMRSASWTIEQDGDYLIYMPFKYYSLSHQFTGIDYVTAVNYYSVQALAVSAENKAATITPMGVFENKVEGFETVMNADGTEVVLEGNYDYMNAELEGDNWSYDDIPGKVDNILTHEFYDHDAGFVRNIKERDEEGNLVVEEKEDGTTEYVNDSDAVDCTNAIKTTWQIAYVNDVLPEKVGEIENPVWFNAAEGGVSMIPNGNNRLYASANVSVTFRDEAGNDIEIVTVAPGSAAAPSAEPTKEATQYETYTFAGWVDKDGNAVDLSAVTENTVVYASFVAEFANPYIDIKENDWYFDAVKYVTINGLMNGVSGNSFGPNTVTTRAMVVTILYRLEGEPAVDSLEAHPFTDVEAGQWYTDAIKWAYNTKIVNGKSATTFVPAGNITREEFALIMYRYADEIKGYYVEAGKASLADLYDRDSVSDWAAAAVKWAIADADDMNTTGFKAYNKTPLLGGKAVKDGKPVLDPKGNATRAEIATMLQRFLEGEHIAK